MNFARLFTNAGLFVIEDVHAKRRVTDAPESIKVAYLQTDDMINAIGEAASTYPAPIALILETGQVMVVADGGKGGIIVQGQEGALPEEQQAALSTVSEILCKHYDVLMEGAPKPKSRTTKTSSTETQTAEVEPEAPTVADEVENPVDGDSVANDEAPE